METVSKCQHSVVRKDDRESSTAFFVTNVPWIAPVAYLHVIFKPIGRQVLEEAGRRLRMPIPLSELLKTQNGAILFSGALSIYGVHAPSQLLNRSDPFSRLPFNIEDENNNWPPVNRTQFLAIAGYGFDGSQVCIDRTDSRVHLFHRASNALAPTPTFSWKNIEDWIVSETSRLSTMFDSRGKRIVDERLTPPQAGSSA
jgi:hypothetical protein